MPELVLVIASYPDAARAEASRDRLAAVKITSHVLPKVPGWWGRMLGRREHYHLGVSPTESERAKALLREQGS